MPRAAVARGYVRETGELGTDVSGQADVVAVVRRALVSPRLARNRLRQLVKEMAANGETRGCGPDRRRRGQGDRSQQNGGVPAGALWTSAAIRVGRGFRVPEPAVHEYLRESQEDPHTAES